MKDILYTQEQQIDDELVGFAIAQRGVDWYAARYVLPIDSTEAEAEQLRADVGHSLLEQMKV
jgi:hypothetical protein